MQNFVLTEKDAVVTESAGLDRLRLRSRKAFEALDRAEIHLVLRAMRHAERGRLLHVARLLTWCGNGWLYPAIALTIILTARDAGGTLTASIGSVAIAFVVYPKIKKVLARARPCDYVDVVVQAASPLDRYSCPSGHAMTAAAFFTPLLFASVLVPLAIGCWAAIAWSRVALGHHYVSDIVLGSMLGTAIAATVVAVM